ncbi:MAG: tyrosine--tRNA ligase, partial [Muribaculaceae bacterium]|nr:tyrosine--tRNA ligase [Muribaculaceae bacterium]
ILFSNHAGETLHKIDEDTLLAVFEGVPQFEVAASVIEAGVPLIDLLTEYAAVFASKGEMRKLTQGGGVSVNKEKVADPQMKIDGSFLLNGKYILAQRGKKNYYLIIVK